MSYTDQDVERVAQKIYESDLFKKVDANDQWLPWERLVQIAPTAAQRYRDMAQTAVDALRELMLTELESMEREPLEEVLRVKNWKVTLAHSHTSDGVALDDAWFAYVVDWHTGRHLAHENGATIDEAIRNAVAAAKGEKA